jgi:predicted transposase YbfD/YdcC
MTTNFPTAPPAYGLNRPSAAVTVEKSLHASHTEILITPVEKDHGRLEVRRCYAFAQIDCLHAPERWPDLTSFAVIASERTTKGKTTLEHRYYISSLPPDAAHLNQSIRQHWRVENSLHWCLDVVFGDDRMRARTNNAAHNFAVVRHFALNLIRLAPAKRKGGLKVRRLIAPTSDAYRAEILGLV